jgi:hydrogenase maturation protein HypF
MACAWLVAAQGAGSGPPATLAAQVSGEAWRAVTRMAETGFAAPETTSMGRLFDAVAALCGVRAFATYEGQAAIELEAVADASHGGAYELGSDLDARPLVPAIIADLRAGVGVPLISARFHRAVACATADACAAAASQAGTELVVLSGGVFQNRLLLRWTGERLDALGLRLLLPERLPANDGGIAFGQAAVAAARP